MLLGEWFEKGYWVIGYCCCQQTPDDRRLHLLKIIKPALSK